MVKKRVKAATSFLLAASIVCSSVLEVGAARQSRTANLFQNVRQTSGAEGQGKYVEGEAVVLINNTQSAVKRSKSAMLEVNGIKVTGSVSFTENSAKRISKTKSLTNGYTFMEVASYKHSTKQLIDILEDMPDVTMVEPNYLYKAESITTDAYSKYQWTLQNDGHNGGTKEKDIQVDKIWSNGSSKEEKVVAVLDSGVNLYHEDIVNNLWLNENTRNLPGRHGYDFCNNSGEPMDDNGHGTHCAGIIGATRNEKGISGVAQNVKIMALKFLDSSAEGDLFNAVRAYQYIYKAQSLGVNVVAVNNSFGSTEDSDILNTAIDLVGKNGTLSVCAAGNQASDNDDSPAFPASALSKYIISVAASDENGDLASFSNYGMKSVDVAAPGTNVLSSVAYPCFNPTLYDNPSYYFQKYNDFESNTTMSFQGKLSGKYNGIPTISKDSSHFFGTEGASLKLDIKNASQNDVYNLYFPYTTKESKSEIYESIMCRFASTTAEDAMSSNIMSMTDAVLTAQDTLSNDYNGVEAAFGGLYLSPGSGWNHIFDSKYGSTPSGVNRALVVTIQIVYDGDFSFYFDDVAVSNANIDTAEFGQYDFYSGTSMAAPAVSGAVALISGARPELSAEQVKNVIVHQGRKENGLKDKVMSGNTLDLSSYFTNAPMIAGAKLNSDKTISVSGSFFTASQGAIYVDSVPVDRAKVTWSDNLIKIPSEGIENNQVTITVETPSGAISSSIYAVTGKKTFAKIKTLPQIVGDRMITDGKYMYFDGGVGNLYRASTAPNSDADLIGTLDKYKAFPNASASELENDLYFDADLVYLNGTIYTMAAIDSGFSKSTAFVSFNLKKGSWEILKNTPKDVVFNNLDYYTFTAFNGKLYLIGGVDLRYSEPSKAVYIYQPETKKWVNGPSLPEGRFNTKAVQSGRKLVVAMGGNASGAAVNMLILDGNIWSESVSLPDILGTADSLILPANRQPDAFFGYDPQSETYSLVVLRNYYDAVVGIDNKGLIITGLAAKGLGDTFHYNIANNTFTPSAYQFSSLTSGYDVTGISIGSKFYAVERSFDPETYEASSLLKSIPISSGMLKVSTTASGGKISGTGYYLPGQKAALKAVPNSNYYLSSFQVGSVVIKGNSYSFTVNSPVTAKALFKKYATKVTINRTRLNYSYKKRLYLKASVYRAYRSVRTVKWVSSNTKYATVSRKGVVTFKRAGIGKMVYIYAKATDGSTAKAVCRIKIVKR